MGGDPLTFVITADPPPRLDKALARDVPEAAALSRTRLVRLIDDGRVQVNDRRILDPKARVAEGDQIRIDIPEAQDVDVVAQDIPLDILHEDADLIVINKAAGMVVHPAPGSPSGTLVNALLHHFGGALSGIGGDKRPGIVHRIDKETSGVLVVAKSDKAHHGLAAQFEAHSAERLYTAICYGAPQSNDPRLHGLRGVSFETGDVMKVTTQLARHKTDRQKQAVLFGSGRHAVTRLWMVETFGDPPCLSLVNCWLETGRTHQIRVHMAYAGHGLVGDPVYGGRRRLSPRALGAAGLDAVAAFPRQALHAAVLGFDHPITGDKMRFEAPMPGDMAALLQSLRQ